MKERITKVFIIIDEEPLEVVKNKEGETLKFKTAEEANDYASERFELWSVQCVYLSHRFIHHEPNM